MANLKPVIKNDFVKSDGKANIKIRISHRGPTGKNEVRYISTPWSIEPKFMNENGTISGKYPGQLRLNMAINQILADYNGILEGIGKEIVLIPTNTLVKKLRNNETSGASFIFYIKERIKVLRKEKRESYADTYQATIKWIEAFTGKTEVYFREINPDFLQRLERYLLAEGKSINTVRIYINNIRAVFNHAIDNDVIKIDLFPFRKFKTKKGDTIKRNITIEQWKKLMKHRTTPARHRAMDLFNLSLYLNGMNFKDMLHLSESNIKNGRIEFLRYKTKDKKPFKQSIKLVPEAQAIINKYKGQKYLLYLLDQQNPNRKTERHKDITKDTDKLLKKIMKAAGLNIPKFGSYYARGTFATIGYKLGIADEVISECLGHSHGIEQTNVYIERDYIKLDEAQSMIIKKLLIP